MLSHGSVAPVMGAALAGSGVQLSGMCPSPASRPLVGSKPIQPAPGRYFAPSVQVGEIHLRAARSVQGFHVGCELDEIATDEPRREAQRAQQRHEQPAGVAARAGGFFECLLGRLHTGFEADGVADLLLEPPVHLDEEVDRGRALFQILRKQRIDQRQHARRGRGEFHEGREFLPQRGVVGEGENARAFLEEKIERVVDRHFRDQIHLDGELAHLLRKDEPRVPVGKGILLPVDEMLPAGHALGVAENVRPAMRCRAQAHDMRRVSDRAIVAVGGAVVERDVDGHQNDEGRMTKDEPARVMGVVRGSGFVISAPTICCCCISCCTIISSSRE